MSSKRKPGAGKLFAAIEQRDLESLKELLAQGADANEVKNYGYINNVTPLMNAAATLFVDAVDILLQAGADPHVRAMAGTGSKGGATALHKGITGANTRLRVQDPQERIRIVKSLLKAGADPNVVAQDTNLPLFYSASTGNYEVTAMLIEAGAEVETWPSGCVPPLVGCVFGVPPGSMPGADKYQKVVELLLEKGAPLDCEDSSGATSLIAAAFRACEPLVNFFLSRGADVRHQAKDGRTPLLCIATFVRFARLEEDHSLALRIAKRLVEAGVDVNARNSDGESALDIASKAQNPLVANYLKGVSSPVKVS